MRNPFPILALAALAASADAQGMTFDCALNGGEVVAGSGSVSTAAGRGRGSLELVSKLLDITVNHGVSGTTVSHLHAGAEGVVASSSLLTLSGSGATATGTLILTSSQETLLRNGELYLDVHKVGNPVPEIRGQLRLNIATTSGAGTGGIFPPIGPLLSFVKTQFFVDEGTGGVLYEAVGNVHVGPNPIATVNIGPPNAPSGPSIFTLDLVSPGGPGTGPVWSGLSPPLTDPEMFDFLAGNMHVLISTDSFPAGEARGQVRPGPLNGNARRLKTANGGEQHLVLEAGPIHAGKTYLMLGSATGTMPGTPSGPGILPLNIDPYFLFLLNNPNPQSLCGSFGLLDQLGRAETTFKLAPGLMLMAPLTLWHAYSVIDPFGPPFIVMNSNPVPIDIEID